MLFALCSLFRILKFVEQLRGGAVQCGVHPFRPDLAQRAQHESAAVHQRVRQRERGGAQHLAAAVDKVDVDDAVGIYAAVRFGRAPQQPFNALRGAQQLFRREAGIDQQHAVQKGIRAVEAPRRGFAGFALGHHRTHPFGQQARGAAQVSGAVAEVRAERDDGTHQAFTSAA